MLQKTEIDQLIEEIVLGYEPEKIYLFGSYASGKQTSDSDIDLLIIKNTTKRKIERNREVRKCIKTFSKAGLDVFVSTPLNYRKVYNKQLILVKRRLLQESLFMKEFEKWFKKAENDLLVIKNNMSSDEIPIDACCFHAPANSFS